MKEKLLTIKDRCLKLIRDNDKIVPAVVIFCIVSLGLILTAMLVLNEYVVSVCALVILEVAMVACLHKAELWKHGILVAAQLVTGAILHRIWLVVICVLAYAAATVTLQFMVKKTVDSDE